MNYSELIKSATAAGWDKWEYIQSFQNHDALPEMVMSGVVYSDAELYTMTNIQKWLLDEHGIWVGVLPANAGSWFYVIYHVLQEDKALKRGHPKFSTPYDALCEGLMEAIKQVK